MFGFQFLTHLTAILYLLSTVQGIKNLPAKNNLLDFGAGETIQAEDLNSGTDFRIYDDCSDDPSIIYVGNVHEDTVLEYDRVEFGYGVDGVTLRVDSDSENSGKTICLHLANSSNPPIVTVPFDDVGGYGCEFTTLHADFPSAVAGAQDLFFTFPSGGINVDWFVLNQTRPNFVATQTIEAEDYSWQQNTELYADCSATKYVGSISDTSVIEFNLVDFGSGVEMVTVRVNNFYSGTPLDVSLHLDNSTSEPFVTIPVGQTGSGRCDFFTLDTFLQTRPSGVHDLYLTFPSPVGGYLDLDWLVFNRTVVSN